MYKFKRDLTVYVNLIDSDFIFKSGYSYMGEKVDGGVRVWNIDKSVVVELDNGDVEEYLEIKQLTTR